MIVESLNGLHKFFLTTTLQFVFNKLSFYKATHKTFPCDVPNYFYNDNNRSTRQYFHTLCACLHVYMYIAVESLAVKMKGRAD